jgi:hypothetical protein
MDVISGQSPRFDTTDSSIPAAFKPIELTNYWKKHCSQKADGTTVASFAQEALLPKKYLFGPQTIDVLETFFRESDPDNDGLDAHEISTMLKKIRLSKESEELSNNQLRALAKYLQEQQADPRKLGFDEFLTWVRMKGGSLRSLSTSANSEPSEPIQKRIPPSALFQFRIFFARSGEKAMRNLSVIQFDLVSIIAAGS